MTSPSWRWAASSFNRGRHAGGGGKDSRRGGPERAALLGEAADVVDDVPDLGIGHPFFIAFHVGGCAVVNCGKHLTVARSEVPFRIGEVGRLSAGNGGPVTMAFGTVTLLAQPLIRALAGRQRRRRRCDRILDLGRFGVSALLRERSWRLLRRDRDREVDRERRWNTEDTK